VGSRQRAAPLPAPAAGFSTGWTADCRTLSHSFSRSFLLFVLPLRDRAGPLERSCRRNILISEARRAGGLDDTALQRRSGLSTIDSQQQLFVRVLTCWSWQGHPDCQLDVTDGTNIATKEST